MQGLKTGQYYAFYVISLDFNSVSEPSDETIAVVCVTPGHIESPKFVAATEDTISLSWQKPFDDGGCPILGYELYISEDSGSTWTIVDEETIENKPYLVEHTVTSLTNLG